MTSAITLARASKTDGPCIPWCFHQEFRSTSWGFPSMLEFECRTLSRSHTWQTTRDVVKEVMTDLLKAVARILWISRFYARSLVWIWLTCFIILLYASWYRDFLTGESVYPKYFTFCRSVSLSNNFIPQDTEVLWSFATCPCSAQGSTS